MELSPRRRRALSTALAVFLALESVSAVAAAAVVRPSPAGGTSPDAVRAEAPGNAALAEFAIVGPAGAADATTAGRGTRGARLADPSAAHGDAPTGAAGTASSASTATAPDATVLARAAAAARADARAAAARPVRAAADPLAAVVRADAARADAKGDASTGARAGTPRSTPRSAGFRGRNRVWIPELGISRSLAFFPCSRTRPPDNYMYRWGCAGSNNVYIMGHASSVMRPLHDAYVSGRLHKGMKAYYADAAGRVHAYTVRWWRKTRPTTDASWAWAAQSAPSMTLQTCVGANSQYRLMVRLTEVGG